MVAIVTILLYYYYDVGIVVEKFSGSRAYEDLVEFVEDNRLDN